MINSDNRFYKNDSTLITRLADTAHEQACLIYNERAKTEKADKIIFYDIFNQIFAELIVGECSKAINPMLRDMISRGKAIDLIQDHFNIKNS